jgi:hypothetical protein
MVISPVNLPRHVFKLAAFVLALKAPAAFVPCAKAADLAPHNVVWTNRSSDAVGSMPLAEGALEIHEIGVKSMKSNR